MEVAEDEAIDLGSFFVDEDYSEREFRFGADASLKLLCSNSSMTAHDLTGQIVWPASLLLGYFVAAKRDLFRGKSVIELGAGCGLGGFLAAQYCKEAVITDGNDVVLRLLRNNKSAYDDAVARGSLVGGKVHIRQLLWGIHEEIEAIYGQDTLGAGDNVASLPDFIIGADVILWPNYTEPLLHTIRKLLWYKKREGACFISYIVRATSTTDLLYNLAIKLGLDIENIAIESFLRDEDTPASLKSLEKRMLRISLSESLIEKNSSFIDESFHDFSSVFESSSAPC